MPSPRQATTRSDGGHGIPRPYCAAPALSSNRPFKKRTMPFEILSETAEETDAGFASETTEYSICTSPTATKGSSSDEGAKLLVRHFGSSENPLVCGNGAKASAGNAGTSKVQLINHTSSTRPAAEKMARVKVSFQEKADSCVGTKRSNTQMHRQTLQISATETGAMRCANGDSRAYDVKPRAEAQLRHLQVSSPQPALPSSHCFPALSSRAAYFLHRHCCHVFFKLRGFICHKWREEEISGGEGGFTQGHHLPGTSMDDVNEMKALLNTINQNLKMLETRSKAHPQLLSSKLAPVYFTT